MIPAITGAAGSVSQQFAYKWVAVGNGISTSTSTTASSWTNETDPFSSTGIYGVASNATNLYVAVGDSGKLATSPDGSTWTLRTSSFGASTIWAVAYGNGVWVAVGDSGKLATSSDGITWTQRTSGVATAIYSIAYGNGLWAYGSTAGVLRTATDPTSTWTARTSTLANVVYSYYAPSQAIWVAGSDAGTTGALASSSDGTTWTARTAPYTMLDGASLIKATFSSTASVIALGSTTDYLGITCDVGSSTDGQTWTNRTPAVTAQRISGMAVDDLGTFVVCSDVTSGKFQSSTNGTTWTDRGGVTTRSFFSICHSSGTPSIR